MNEFIAMKTKLFFAASAAVAMLVAGCESIPPGAERGPNGTIAYDVLIESTPPGARIEANGQYIGDAPVHLKIFGDTDGTFHDFGSYYYIVRALPNSDDKNQHEQSAVFRTGHMFSPEDRIPSRINFDMSRQAPAYVPGGPTYYEGAPPPAYYYGPPVYYYPPGPSVRFYFGPGYHRHW